MSFATINEQPCSSAWLHMPWTGVWSATCELHEPAAVSGAVELRLGDTTLRGTVDDGRSGVFAGRQKVTILGGAGGWRKPIPSRPHHNDGTLRASRLAVAAGREVGEVLVVASALDRTLAGNDFSREADSASRVLRLLFGDAWWVGSDGITRVDSRAIVDATGKAQILEYDPQTRRAELAIDGNDVSVVFPGASLADPVRLGASPFVVRDVGIEVAGTTVRAHAMAGSFEERLRELTHDESRSFFGTYRYRVYRMAGDRVELQIVRRATGLPDALPVSMSPGVAGAWSSLAEGSIVLVQFLEGDPSLPIVTGFTRKDNGAGGAEPGFIPAHTILDAEKLDLGPTALDVLIGEALGRLLRSGERVAITGVRPGPGAPDCTITLHPSIVGPGAPGAGYSRAQG